MGRLYDRTSRRCDPGSIDPALRAAISEHAEAHQLGDVLAAALDCCETHSVRLYRPTLRNRLKGMSDPDAEHRSVALFTPVHFLVAVTGERRGTMVMSARLDGISVSVSGVLDGLSPELRARAAALAESGFSVTGMWSGAQGVGAEPSSYFVGLGDQPDAGEFRGALTAAVTQAKAR